MTKRDGNGWRIKPGHDGHAGPAIGPYVWLVHRTTDDKLYGVWTSRHEAVGAIATEHVLRVANQREWLNPVRVPVGSVRLNDVVMLDTEP